MSRNAPVCKLLAVVNAFLYNYCDTHKRKMQFMPKRFQLEYLLDTTFINNAVTPVNNKTRITKHFHGNIMDNRINNKHKSFISLSMIKSA